MLAFMCGAYDEEELESDIHIIMCLRPFLTPIEAYVTPLSKKLSDRAMGVFQPVAPVGNCDYDEMGSTDKRCRRQDIVGAPFCITMDFETEDDNCVTVHHRDSTG